MSRSLCRCSEMFAVHGRHATTLGRILRDPHTVVKCRQVSCCFRNVVKQTTGPQTPQWKNHWNATSSTIENCSNFHFVRQLSSDTKDAQTTSLEEAKEPDIVGVGSDYRDKASLTWTQKKLLVWTGCYKSVDDIPDKIRVEFLNKSFRAIFLMTWTWYIAFILMAACIMILLWKWEWSKGVEDELRSTVARRDDESDDEYEKRFQKVLKKDIHFMRFGYELDRPGQASWVKQEVEMDPKKFHEQRERMKEKHLEAERRNAMEQYIVETEGDWEKRMEQQLKAYKK